jgi:Homeodomain-like domain
MRHVVRMVVAIRFALSTRRDLLLEILALRHQQHVLVRSNRRFRLSDRLLWLVLRQVWSRWRDALVLVQPATVDRWHREGFHRCWRRRSRRPARPRIDSECRALIRRLAAENCLWGAPRIHGELLKLGVIVSERTVSRYLPDRRRAPSQTWRTFLANHLGQFTFISFETSLHAPGGDDVVDGSTFRHTLMSCDAPDASHQCAVAERPARQRTLPGTQIVQDQLHARISIRTSCGRGPPTQGRFGPTRVYARRVAPAPDLGDERRVRRLTPRAAARHRGSTSSADEPSSFGRGVHLCVSVSPQSDIGEAQVSNTSSASGADTSGRRFKRPGPHRSTASGPRSTPTPRTIASFSCGPRPRNSGRRVTRWLMRLFSDSSCRSSRPPRRTPWPKRSRRIRVRSGATCKGSRV